MLIIVDEIETLTRDFDFWGNACGTIGMLSDEEIVMFQEMLAESNPKGLTTTQINDFFAFDTDFIAECLGYADDCEMYEDRRNFHP